MRVSRFLLFGMALVCSFSACRKIPEPEAVVALSITEENQQIIANALGINVLDTIHAGAIQRSAREAENILVVLAEDGDEYKLHLASDGHISSIWNLHPGEFWSDTV